MKKTITLLTAIILIFTFASCKKENNISSGSNISTSLSTEENSKIGSSSETVDDNSENVDHQENSEIKNTDISSKVSRVDETSSNIYSSSSALQTANSTIPNSSKTDENSTIQNNSSAGQSGTSEKLNITYTVTYDANGGWGETNDSTHKYDEERALSKNNYKRAGYSFSGWDENPSAVSPKYSDKEIVSNLTTTNHDVIKLYAIWKVSQTSKFDECKRAVTGIKEVDYHTTFTDNSGISHEDVAVFMNRDSSPGVKRRDERYTNGLFSKIKGTLFLGGEYTLDTYTNIQLIIKADGVVVYKSVFFKKYSNSESFEVDISGANIVEIYVADPVSNNITAWNKGGDIIIENLLLVR